MKGMSVHKLAFTALIAAIYAALTIGLGFMSYGYVQFRLSEALCILPFFFPFTSWGLFAGCLLANLMSPSGLLDMTFGSLATLLSCLSIAAIGMSGSRRSWLRCVSACLMPVIFNAVIVGAVISLTSAPLSMFMTIMVFPFYAATVALGEAVVMFAAGLPLMRLLPKKNKYFAQFREEA